MDKWQRSLISSGYSMVVLGLFGEDMTKVNKIAKLLKKHTVQLSKELRELK